MSYDKYIYFELKLVRVVRTYKLTGRCIKSKLGKCNTIRKNLFLQVSIAQLVDPPWVMVVHVAVCLGSNPSADRQR